MQKKIILADTFEAVLAAIYLNFGFSPVHQFYGRLVHFLDFAQAKQAQRQQCEEEQIPIVTGMAEQGLVCPKVEGEEDYKGLFRLWLLAPQRIKDPLQLAQPQGDRDEVANQFILARFEQVGMKRQGF